MPDIAVKRDKEEEKRLVLSYNGTSTANHPSTLKLHFLIYTSLDENLGRKTKMKARSLL